MRKEKVILLALLIIGQIFIFPINVNPVFGSEPYELKRKIQVPTNAVSYVKLSQQGNSVLAGPAVPVSKTEVILYNANTGKELAKFPASNELSSIDFSSNGNYVATFREDRLQVYDTRQGNVVFKRDSLISTSKLSFGPENEKLAFSACLKKEEGKKCEESEVRVLDLKDNETRVLAKSKEKVYSVNWGNKNFIACVLSDPSGHHVIKFYNPESGKPIGMVKSVHNPVSFSESAINTRPISFGYEDKLFAATSIGGINAHWGNRTVLVWKMSTGELLKRIELTKAITSIEICRKNDILAISTMDGNISFWEIKNGRKLYSYKAHDSPVLEIDLSSNGKVLATGSEDNTVKIWKLELERIAKGIHTGESKDSQEAHSTTLPNGIATGSKRDVQYSSGNFPIHFDNDNRRELVIVSNKNENSFVKIFPLNEEKLPYSMNIDQYDSSNLFEIMDPNINILSTSVRQTDHNSVTFTMNLVESPELIPDKIKNKLQNEDKYLEYIWKILAGQNDIDENNNGYSYAEYYIRVTGDGKSWNAILENKANSNTLPIKEFNIVGNELEVQVDLHRLGNPSFLRYSAVARSPEKGKADIFEDKTSPPLKPEINLFDQKLLPPEQSRPGELLISPEFNSDKNIAVTKVYRIPALIEELERGKEIPTTFTVITKEGTEYLFEFSKGRVEISKG